MKLCLAFNTQTVTIVAYKAQMVLIYFYELKVCDKSIIKYILQNEFWGLIWNKFILIFLLP